MSCALTASEERMRAAIDKLKSRPLNKVNGTRGSLRFLCDRIKSTRTTTAPASNVQRVGVLIAVPCCIVNTSIGQSTVDESDPDDIELVVVPGEARNEAQGADDRYETDGDVHKENPTPIEKSDEHATDNRPQQRRRTLNCGPYRHRRSACRSGK